MELVTGENDNGRRLDRILRKALPDHPLPLIHRLLRQGLVFVDGKAAKAQDRLNAGAKINIPSLKTAKTRCRVCGSLNNTPNITPRASSLSSLNDVPAVPQAPSLPCPQIIWERDGLIAVNKPEGLDVHGKNSLDEMVRSFLAGKITPSLSFKPGPLHRLDKPTSGLVVFSTSIEGARLFSSLMREGKVKKTYLAIVEGKVEKEEIWEDRLLRDKERKKTFVLQEGKNAKTTIKPLALKNGYSFVSAQIATGRTHQIRAQAAAHGRPLMGDKKYGGHGSGGFFLHAWKLEFLQYAIEAPLPEKFKKKITKLFGNINSASFAVK